MPYQVSWQSVSIKSQRPVHVLAPAARASTPQQAPAAARIVAAKMPSLVMAVPLPQLGPSWLGKCQLQDTFQPWRKISILVSSAPQRFCTAWRTGRADPRSKLRHWRELSKPKYKAFDRWLIQ